VKHEEAFRRLPDLLADRDDADLLAHVRGCAECQRQLFLLGRVDRMLRDSASAQRAAGRHRPTARRLLVAAAAAAAVAATLALVLPRTAHSHQFVLKTASGRSVAQAVMGHSDTHNASLALTTHGMPVEDGHVFVLWAGDTRASMQVGRFIVDAHGNCRAQFNLPTNHDWSRLWITTAAAPTAVVATT
jgi:anti-sigma-K factor RskA